MGQQNIIELNGKRYDAITGVVLGLAEPPAQHLPRNPRAVDGFIRSRVGAHATPVVNKPAPVHVAKPHTTTSATTKKKMDVSRPRPANSHLKHHQPQKGKTLMRRAVQKPAVSMKPAIKVQPPSEIAPASAKTIAKPLAKKLSVSNVDAGRLARSKTAAQSSRVQRFQPTAHRPSIASSYVPSAVSHPSAYASGPAIRPVQRAAQAPAVRNLQQPADIFEAAIARATSHEQRPPQRARKHSKLVSGLAGVAAFLIFGGFVAYLNMPGINMQMASMKVGFKAELPTYKPAGYALGNLDTDDKQVRVSFRSGESQYIVTQQASNWNSQTLLENYVAQNSADHQTVQSQGRTIYMWGKGNAAWVDGGVRYDVSGNADLSADDIVKLASSI